MKHHEISSMPRQELSNGKKSSIRFKSCFGCVHNEMIFLKKIFHCYSSISKTQIGVLFNKKSWKIFSKHFIISTQIGVLFYKNSWKNFSRHFAISTLRHHNDHHYSNRWHSFAMVGLGLVWFEVWDTYMEVCFDVSVIMWSLKWTLCELEIGFPHFVVKWANLMHHWIHSHWLGDKVIKCIEFTLPNSFLWSEEIFLVLLFGWKLMRKLKLLAFEVPCMLCNSWNF